MENWCSTQDVGGNPTAFVVNRRVAETMKPNREACHIVLQEPNYQYPVELPQQGWHDSIVFNVHDICDAVPGYTHFTENMARDLIAFIERNKGRDMLVNCDAGMSRSVAVGCLLRDWLGYKAIFHSAGTDAHRNILIYGTVMSILGGYR